MNKQCRKTLYREHKRHTVAALATRGNHEGLTKPTAHPSSGLPLQTNVHPVIFMQLLFKGKEHSLWCNAYGGRLVTEEFDP